MKSGSILAVAAAGALVAWMMPAETPAPIETEAAPSQQDDESGPRLGWYAGQVVLPRSADGHFYADVTVGRATTRMLVDTGASVVALTGSDAQALGITWSNEDIRPVARGASGPVYGVTLTLDSVRLDGFEAQGVQAVVVPEGLPVSLLGQSFLSRIDKIAVEPERMVLGG